MVRTGSGEGRTKQQESPMLVFMAIVVVFMLVAVTVLFLKTGDLTSRLQDLRLDVARLAGRLSQLEGKESPPEAGKQGAVHIPAKEDRGPAVPKQRAEVTPHPPLAVQPVAPKAAEAVSAPTPSVPPVPAPSRTREEWEALIGGKLLNRIGALALIIGVGFFLKYAFDKNWITEWMRVTIGGLTGAAVLLLAARSHRKGLEIFAQGLVGAGIAILYLSVYASFNFYFLVSQPVAFVLMSGVTAITFTQAFKYNSLAVSLLGWLGGFLTPFLLNTGEANAAGLFTYIALLDIAVLAVLLVKDRWIILLPLTLVGTYMMYYLWYGTEYHPENLWTAALFLTLFWALFHALDTAWCTTRRAAFKVARRWGSAANLLAYYGGLYAVLDQQQHDWLAPATLVLGIAYALSAMVIQRRAATETVPVVQNAFTGILLLVVATHIQFEPYTVTMVSALEAVALAWVGRRWNLNYVWYAASGLLLWGALALLVTPGALHAEDAAHFRVAFTQRVAAYLSLIAAAALVLWITRAFQTARGGTIRTALHGGWVLLAFLLLTVECVDYFRQLQETVAGGVTDMLKLGLQRNMSLATLWILFSFSLVAVGVRKSVNSIAIPGFVIAGLAWAIAAMGGFSFVPIAEFQVVLNIRSGALLLVSAVFLLSGRILAASADGKKKRSDLLHYAWIVLIFILCTAETVDFYRQRGVVPGGGSVDELAFMRFMTLGGVWTIYALVLGWAGLRTRLVPLVSAGLWVVILAAIIAGLRGVAYDPLQAYSPILNVRVLIILMAIGGLIWYLRAVREGTLQIDWVAEIRSAMRVLTIILSLVLITAEIRDFFEKAIGNAVVGGENEETARQMENLKQLLLSSSWLVYSILLMAYGIWRRGRSLRVISMGLFGIAILKIFIYDLSFLDTLYRIFSFLGLGVILLAVSYLYQRYRGVIFGGGARETQKE